MNGLRRLIIHQKKPFVDVSLGSKYASSVTAIVILLHKNVFGNIGFLNFLVFSDKILLQFVFSYFTSRLCSRLYPLRTFVGKILVALMQLISLSEDSFVSF